jgi:hypothetical protein
VGLKIEAIVLPNAAANASVRRWIDRKKEGFFNETGPAPMTPGRFRSG